MADSLPPEQPGACLRISTQMADVSLPVRLRPSAVIGEIRTECCCEPSVSVRPLGCGRCGCEIVITQTVCISIPVEYGAEAQAGDPMVICRRTGC